MKRRKYKMKKLISALASALLMYTTFMPVMADTVSISDCDDYESLLNSISASENVSIKLTGDIDLEDTVDIAEAKEVTIDLNGYTIFLDANDESTGRYAFDNSGSLKLIDTTQEHNGTVSSRGIYNRNSFTAENVNLLASGSNGGAALWIYDNSTTNVKNCKVVTENGASGIRSDTSSIEKTIINIEGTTIKSAVHGVITSGSATKITISNSTVEAGGIALAANNGGVLETNNAEIIGNNTYGAKNFMAVKTEDATSSIIMNGGSISSYNGAGCIEASYGKVEATDVVAYVDAKSNYLASAFSASSSGTLTLNNCVSNSKGYGIYVFNSGATIIVNGGEYQADEKVIQVDDSIEVDPSVVNVNDGSFDGDIWIGKNSVENFEIQNGVFTTNVQQFIDVDKTLLSLTSDSNTNYYVGEDSVVSEKISNLAKEGDEIRVLQGNANLAINLDNVQIVNDGKGTLIVNGEETNSTTTAHAHIYGEPTFTWSEDFSKAEATFTCEKNDDTQVLEATITSTKVEPTVDKEGSITYKAEVVFESKEYTDTKEVVLDKLPKPEQPGESTDSDDTEKPSIPEGLTPTIIYGNNSLWNTSSNDGLTFTSNAEYEDFLKVLVDDKEVDSKYYTVKEGSTIVTLKPEYLRTLSVGKHTLAIVSDTGTAMTEFTIKAEAESSVQTGDDSNIMFFAVLAILAAAGAAGAGIYGRRKVQ